MDIKNRTLTFVLKGNTYQIEYPKVGQFLEIEAQKSFLSKGQLGSMIDSGTVMSYMAIELIGIIAFLKVMCPQLIKDLKVNIEDIDLLDFEEIKEMYNKDIKSWYDYWYKLVTKTNEADENK